MALANESGTSQSHFVGECDASGASEPWLGAGAAPLVAYAAPTWRWPATLPTGARFEGSVEVRVLARPGHTRVERRHEVTATDTFVLDGERLSVSVISYRTRGPGGTTQGVFTVSPRVGLVSARDGPADAPVVVLQLERIDRP